MKKAKKKEHLNVKHAFEEEKSITKEDVILKLNKLEGYLNKTEMRIDSYQGKIARMRKDYALEKMHLLKMLNKVKAQEQSA